MFNETILYECTFFSAAKPVSYYAKCFFPTVSLLPLVHHSMKKKLWIRSSDQMSRFSLNCHVLPFLLHIMSVEDTTQANHVCCFKLHCSGPLRRTPCSWTAHRVLSFKGYSNLFVICRLPEWQYISVWWFVPRGWPCRCHCYRQPLCYNCACIYRILAFAEFKVASFQLESEIPFQPLEWPGKPQPRGPGQYNDAWHNSTTVP